MPNAPKAKIQNYHVLLILPTVADMPLLDVTHEYQWITRAFHTETLAGPEVTDAYIWDQTNNRKYDIIHFGTHGDQDGVYLAKNTRMGMDDIARLGRTRGTKLVYVNTCNSARLAQYIVDNGIPAVIASTYEQFDVQAWSTAISYYGALLENGGDFLAAYNLVKPRDGTLSFFRNGSFAAYTSSPIIEDLRNEFAQLVATTNEALSGLKIDYSNIVAEIGDIKETITDIKRAIGRLDTVALSDPQWVQWRKDNPSTVSPLVTLLVLALIILAIFAVGVPVALFMQYLGA